MLLLGVFAMAFAVMLALPETAAARALRLVLVERPAAWLAKLSPAKIIVQGGLFGLIALLLFATRGSELGLLIAQALPELVSWFVAIDAITMLEVALAVWLVATNARVRAAMSSLRTAAWRSSVRCVAVIRTRTLGAARDRARHTLARKRQKPASSDDAGAAYAFA